MKTFLFCLLFIGHITNSFSQTEVLLDSVTHENLSREESTIIGCSASIQSTRGPLFIIDGVLTGQKDPLFTRLNTDDIISIEKLKDSSAFGCYRGLAMEGVYIVITKKNQSPKVKFKKYPFKVFCITNDNWALPQDIYNSIQAKVPNVQITSNTSLMSMPNIRMRGDDNTIVIVDGVRYDASILNALNLADIENIKVSTSAAATNYFINN